MKKRRKGRKIQKVFREAEGVCVHVRKEAVHRTVAEARWYLSKQNGKKKKNEGKKETVRNWFTDKEHCEIKDGCNTWCRFAQLRDTHRHTHSLASKISFMQLNLTVFESNNFI